METLGFSSELAFTSIMQSDNGIDCNSGFRRPWGAAARAGCTSDGRSLHIIGMLNMSPLAALCAQNLGGSFCPNLYILLSESSFQVPSELFSSISSMIKTPRCRPFYFYPLCHHDISINPAHTLKYTLTRTHAHIHKVKSLIPILCVHTAIQVFTYAQTEQDTHSFYLPLFN